MVFSKLKIPPYEINTLYRGWFYHSYISYNSAWGSTISPPFQRYLKSSTSPPYTPGYCMHKCRTKLSMLSQFHPETTIAWFFVSFYFIYLLTTSKGRHKLSAQCIKNHFEGLYSKITTYYFIECNPLFLQVFICIEVAGVAFLCSEFHIFKAIHRFYV